MNWLNTSALYPVSRSSSRSSSTAARPRHARSCGRGARAVPRRPLCPCGRRRRLADCRVARGPDGATLRDANREALTTRALRSGLAAPTGAAPRVMPRAWILSGAGRDAPAQGRLRGDLARYGDGSVPRSDGPAEKSETRVRRRPPRRAAGRLRSRRGPSGSRTRYGEGPPAGDRASDPSSCPARSRSRSRSSRRSSPAW